MTADGKRFLMDSAASGDLARAHHSSPQLASRLQEMTCHSAITRLTTLLICLGLLRFRPRPGNQEVGTRGEAAVLFSTEPLFLIPSPARPAREPGDQARRMYPLLFSREPVFLIPSGWDRSPWKPRDRPGRDAPHFFSREPLLPHSLCAHGRLWPHLWTFLALQRVLPLALRCEEIAKFWEQGKRRVGRCSHSFRQHSSGTDTVLAKVAQEMAPPQRCRTRSGSKSISLQAQGSRLQR